MTLYELFKHFSYNKTLLEGGNLNVNGHSADEINLKVHKRSFIYPILDKLLRDISNKFEKEYKKPIWSQDLLNSKKFLGGSSLHFFDTSNITDDAFVKLKPKVGDIDTQCNKELQSDIKSFLINNTNKQIGKAKLLGFGTGNEQYNALFQFQNPPMNIQIDFEFGEYDTKTNMPNDWFRFSHSSDWADIESGIKGVFHKYLFRALSVITSEEVYVAKLAGRKPNQSIQIEDEPSLQNKVTFAVSSKQGGGVSTKFKLYDKTPKKNGLPVWLFIKPEDRHYEQNLSKQFKQFFNTDPTGNDSEKQLSFKGTLDLINKYCKESSKKQAVVESFLKICFEPGTQMITRDDPKRDAEIKFAAIDVMLEKLNMKSMRTKAIKMAKEYEQDFRKKQTSKLEEDTQIKVQKRKGMPHLHDLKAADFLDLLDELHEDGRFKLQNIPLNVKVDGAGGRFGKNTQGKPFMGTSNSEANYQANFLKFNKDKGITDPVKLHRAATYDKLFYEMMNAIKMVDSKLGDGFLINKQVICEVLYLPMATETTSGKLKFVGIEYDKLPDGVQLALVPFRVVQGDTGEELPDSDKFIKKLLSVGRSGSVMFINNSLTQNGALDVTEIIKPLENIYELKQIVNGVADKRDKASQQLKREIESKLQPVKDELEKAIIADPNIIGKNILGKDYEGIVLNSRLGPIKVTSQKQRDVMTSKKVVSKSNKTAVVAVGNFIGHKGHQELWEFTRRKAKEVGGEPFLFIGNAVGENDPIPVEDKIKTWHLMYPQYTNNISAVMTGGSMPLKIKHELINPTPGQPPKFDNVIIMVGEDQTDLKYIPVLLKMRKFAGYEHINITQEITPRGTKMSSTKLRNILKIGTEQEALAMWTDAFNGGNSDAKKLPVAWIKHLMEVSKDNMNIFQKLTEEISQNELTQLEKYLNTFWEKAGMDIHFSKHFLDRANDERNQKPVTINELARLFIETYRQYAPRLKKKYPGFQAVLKDLKTDVNSPFVLIWNKFKNELELLAKTCMRKHEFVPNSDNEPLITIAEKKN